MLYCRLYGDTKAVSSIHHVAVQNRVSSAEAMMKMKNEGEKTTTGKAYGPMWVVVFVDLCILTKQHCSLMVPRIRYPDTIDLREEHPGLNMPIKGRSPCVKASLIVYVYASNHAWYVMPKVSTQVYMLDRKIWKLFRTRGNRHIRTNCDQFFCPTTDFFDFAIHVSFIIPLPTM